MERRSLREANVAAFSRQVELAGFYEAKLDIRAMETSTLRQDARVFEDGRRTRIASR
jgi:hypothetical protein